MAFILSRSRFSTADSPMPKIWRVRLTMAPSVQSRRKGTARSRNMGLHSEGGPGSMTTRTPSDSKPQPGAVPQSFWKGTQPSGR